MVNFIYFFIWAIKHFNRIIIAFHLDLFGIVQFVCVHFQRNFINVGFLFDNIIWWCNTCSTNAHYTGSVASVGVNKTSFFTKIRLHYLIIHFIQNLFNIYSNTKLFDSDMFWFYFVSVQSWGLLPYPTLCVGHHHNLQTPSGPHQAGHHHPQQRRPTQRSVHRVRYIPVLSVK